MRAWRFRGKVFRAEAVLKNMTKSTQDETRCLRCLSVYCLDGQCVERITPAEATAAAVWMVAAAVLPFVLAACAAVAAACGAFF